MKRPRPGPAGTRHKKARHVCGAPSLISRENHITVITTAFIFTQRALLYVHFLEQTVSVAPLVHHEDDIADVNTDAACQVLLEVDVA